MMPSIIRYPNISLSTTLSIQSVNGDKMFNQSLTSILPDNHQSQNVKCVLRYSNVSSTNHQITLNLSLCCKQTL